MAKPAEEQNIKIRARRRLIGAIALVVAVVVILPMVLDSEPKNTGKDIELRIPDADKAGEFVPGVSVSDAAEAVSLAASSVSPVSLVQAPVKPEKIAVAEPVKKAASDARPDVKHEVKPEGAPDARHKPDVKPEVSPQTVKRVEVDPAEILSGAPVEKSAGTYIVQAGAFSNALTARQEADKIKALGFNVYTEQVGGVTRVRAGPYGRSRADEVRSELEKHGFHPVLAAVNGHAK
ncbi:MAG: SPOR domain-containing protein [Gallionella sp.]|nr:SPOR domain-containing protein [Gallionella sp.]